MEGVAALGLVSNVLGFITLGTRLCGIIKEYSSAAGFPHEILAISKRLELIVQMLTELDDSGRARLDREQSAVRICFEEAEGLRLFLEGLRIDGDGDGGRLLKWLRRRKLGMEKGWKAIKTVNGREKLERFQVSLDRMMGLINMQQSSRVEYDRLR